MPLSAVFHRLDEVVLFVMDELPEVWDLYAVKARHDGSSLKLLLVDNLTKYRDEGDRSSIIGTLCFRGIDSIDASPSPEVKAEYDVKYLNLGISASRVWPFVRISRPTRPVKTCRRLVESIERRAEVLEEMEMVKGGFVLISIFDTYFIQARQVLLCQDVRNASINAEQGDLRE